MTDKKSVIPVGRIENRILLIRGEKVLMDSDLAEFYGVETKRLNEQVKRNINRFPEDFMFQLTRDEKEEVVANCDHLNKYKYSSYLPYSFTEHGALMVASVLNTPKAIDVSVFIVRAFVNIRKLLVDNKELQRKISNIEKKLTEHDDQIVELVEILRQLINPKLPPKNRRIGFLE